MKLSGPKCSSARHYSTVLPAADEGSVEAEQYDDGEAGGEAHIDERGAREEGGLVERVQLRGQVYALQARAAAEGAAADAGERGRELDLGEGLARMEGVVSDGGQGGGEDHLAKGSAV